MIKKTCPNGHVYDQSIYGDICPLCPSTTHATAPVSNPTMPVPDAVPPMGGGGHTKVAPPNINPNMGTPGMNVPPQLDPTGGTHISPSIKQQMQEAEQAQAQVRRTVIRHNPAMGGGAVKAADESRKLVGFLVTYNRTPMGKAFNIYEGRNVIGRDPSCDIALPDDNQMSGKHMSIRYLSGNNKFRFHDEMSSNGTYVNKELLDDGELQNYDIIRVGSTLFIFIAIPQI